MFYMPQGQTRAALLIEHVDEKGEKNTLIYHIAPPITVELTEDYSTNFNLFDGVSRVYHPEYTRINIDAYLGAPMQYDSRIPDEREEIEHTKEITDGNDEIIIDEDGFEEWQDDDA